MIEVIDVWVLGPCEHRASLWPYVCTKKCLTRSKTPKTPNPTSVGVSVNPKALHLNPKSNSGSEATKYRLSKRGACRSKRENSARNEVVLRYTLGLLQG